MQERTGTPSSSTVQAPHTPCSQPRCVPVRSRPSRRKSASDVRGSTAASTLRPLTVRDSRHHRAASVDGAAEHGDMHMAVHRIGQAAGRQNRVGRGGIEALARSRGRSGRRTAARRRRARSAARRPRRSPPARRPRLGIDQHGADGMGEIAGLAAGFDIAPAGRLGHGGHADGFEHFARSQGRFERAGDELGRRQSARSRAARAASTRASSAVSAVTQSAAGSAWLRLPPIVPRLRTAR